MHMSRPHPFNLFSNAAEGEVASLVTKRQSTPQPSRGRSPIFSRNDTRRIQHRAEGGFRVTRGKLQLFSKTYSYPKGGGSPAQKLPRW